MFNRQETLQDEYVEYTREYKLRRFMFLSLAFHMAAILTLFLKDTVAPSKPREYLPSLRVDLVALPDRKTNEPQNVPLPAQPKEEPKPDEKPATPPKAPPKVDTKPEQKGDYSVVKKKKHEKPSVREAEAQNKMKAALARIRALERVKALQAGEQIKGNQVSKGSALSGEAKASLETTYFDVVVERVRSYWELPRWLQEQNLSVKVQIFISKRGEIRSFEFVKSSGNAQFDAEVKRTLQISSPFPPPPEGIAEDLSKNGVVLGFPI